MQSPERRQTVMDAVRVLLRDCPLDPEPAAQHLQALGVDLAPAEVADLLRGAGDHPAVPSEWSDREHVAEPVVMDAQKLVDVTGSVELAKKAVDTVGRRHTETDAGAEPAQPAPQSGRSNAN